MYEYEEDFYHEPSEFEMQMNQLKDSLMKSIKEEFVNEMERLKAENNELQSVKKDFDKIKNEYKNKERQLEQERNDYARKLRRERLVELLKDHELILYRASADYVYPPKCDKCDKFGKIEYITPLGRKASESCLCRESKTVYRTKEFVRYEFRLNRDKNGLIAWYRQYSEDEDGLTWDNSITLEDVYSPDTKFEDIKSYSSTFFKTEEECQAYCDYLNSKN